MEAAILAGGLGTRLNSRLRDLPKPMAPIRGRPFLELLLDQLVVAGCERVLLSVGHLHEAILDRFQQSYRGLPLQYVIEEKPLGTGGAIRLALSQATDACVMVLNGDTYLELDFTAILAHHISVGRSMTMVVTQVPDTSRYGGVVIGDHLVTGFIEKGHHGPGWINAGVYVLNRNFLWPAELPSQFSFETDMLGRFVDRIQPSTFPYAGYFLDIGVPEDLERAQLELGGSSKSPDRFR